MILLLIALLYNPFLDQLMIINLYYELRNGKTQLLTNFILLKYDLCI